eukprot:6177386-Pleurochrysis_carterae.AAC.4
MAACVDMPFTISMGYWSCQLLARGLKEALYIWGLVPRSAQSGFSCRPGGDSSYFYVSSSTNNPLMTPLGASLRFALR